jgi:hypothetical protein
MEYERFSQSVRQLLDSEHQAREKSTRIIKILPTPTGIESDTVEQPATTDDD